MFYWCIATLLLLLPFRNVAQQSDPAWLNPERQVALMQQAVELYTCIVNSNNWYNLPANLNLSPGDTNQAIPKLQYNLLLTKDLPFHYQDSTFVYDSVLVSATSNFQRRHGLKPDGLLGPETVAAINVPPSWRLKLLRANLQRWKTSTADLEFPLVMINIPDYRLFVLDSCNVPLQMRVIVGKKAMPTYLNKTELLSIVVNPSWNLPRSISVNEIVPILRRNPNYLNKRNLKVYKNGELVNPWQINWKQVSSSNFDYQITQLPGKDNELGQFKFLLNNSKASQYMHDTPRKELFNYDQRDFSHGCIRLEKPYELALYLLQHRSGQTEAKAKELLTRRDHNLYLRIRKPMPLLILYQTSWVSQDGQVQFRKDVYGYENPKL